MPLRKKQRWNIIYAGVSVNVTASSYGTACNKAFKMMIKKKKISRQPPCDACGEYQGVRAILIKPLHKGD